MPLALFSLGLRLSICDEPVRNSSRYIPKYFIYLDGYSLCPFMNILNVAGILSPDFLKIINSVFAALSDILLASSHR